MEDRIAARLGGDEEARRVAQLLAHINAAHRIPRRRICYLVVEVLMENLAIFFRRAA